MGEYATYAGEQVKLGTCEDMYYLRDDQRQLIEGYDFASCLEELRFRFPFPDEDSLEPGQFSDHNRGVRIPGWTLPEDFNGHGSIQFKHEKGYLVSLPCPEGPDTIEGLTIHRNGWNGGPVVKQQKHVGDELVTVVACGTCDAAWRLDLGNAAEVVAAFVEEAGREENRPEWDETTQRYSGPCRFEPAHSDSHRAFLLAIADRILAGYAVTV